MNLKAAVPSGKEPPGQPPGASAGPPGRDALPGAIPGWPEPRLRLVELILVCSVAFGGSVLLSGSAIFSGTPPDSTLQGSMKWVYFMFHEAVSLGLLWYVLRRRSRTFGDLGLRWQPSEIVMALPMWMVATGAGVGWFAFLRAVAFRVPGYSGGTMDVGPYLFQEGFSLGLGASLLLNPFFEELIVRAFLMTELKSLTRSTTIAVGGSVLLQTSYHFYQGATGALSHVPMFLILSLYYAGTNRILAPILVHFLIDALGLGYYFMQAAHGAR